MIKQQVDSNFKVVLFVLIVNFYINTYLLFILGSIHIRGIGLPGYFRFAISGVVGILFLGQLKKYSYVLAQQRGLCVAIFLFFLILAIQFFIVDDKVLHLQGSVKYFFYFTCLLLSLYSCYYDSKNARNALVIVAIILFASVIFFYPYIICKAGMNPYERLTVYMRSSFLLRAGNEDAHFMLTLFPFLLAKFHGKKFLTIVFLVFCFLALIYNGTRSTLVMAPIVTLLYYNIISKRKLLLGGLLTALIVAGMSALPQILALMFEKEMGLILNYQDFLYGDYVGGNLSRRVSFIWLPTIKDTIQNSFWVGYGSNGWSLVAGKVAMMGFMNGKYVASSPHNLFVWNFVNWGIFGLLFIVYIICKCIKYSLFSIRNSFTSHQKRISSAIFCSWIAFLSWSMIANSNGAHGWTVLILLIILSIANRNHIVRSAKEVVHEN